MSRSPTPTETLIITLLAKNAGLDLGALEDVRVFVVDQEYGSLRSSNLKESDRVKSRAECQFDDEDGIPVCIILLLDSENNFGELVFWRGDGSPILSVPSDQASFHSFRKILPP